jgi:hypothetical protein
MPTFLVEIDLSFTERVSDQNIQDACMWLRSLPKEGTVLQFFPSDTDAKLLVIQFSIFHTGRQMDLVDKIYARSKMIAGQNNSSFSITDPNKKQKIKKKKPAAPTQFLKFSDDEEHL